MYGVYRQVLLWIPRIHFSPIPIFTIVFLIFISPKRNSIACFSLWKFDFNLGLLLLFFCHFGYFFHFVTLTDWFGGDRLRVLRCFLRSPFSISSKTTNWGNPSVTTPSSWTTWGVSIVLQNKDIRIKNCYFKNLQNLVKLLVHDNLAILDLGLPNIDNYLSFKPLLSSG